MKQEKESWIVEIIFLVIRSIVFLGVWILFSTITFHYPFLTGKYIKILNTSFIFLYPFADLFFLFNKRKGRFIKLSSRYFLSYYILTAFIIILVVATLNYLFS